MMNTKIKISCAENDLTNATNAKHLQKAATQTRCLLNQVPTIHTKTRLNFYYLSTIFLRSSFPRSKMAMLSNGGVSSPDFWIFLTIIFIALISILLNPIVFRHNFRKKTSSIARRIYMALSAVDFLSSIALATMFNCAILPPKEEQCIKEHSPTYCQTDYYKYYRPASVQEKAMTCVGWSLTMISMSTTSTLAISRWFQISHPLRIYSVRSVEATVAGSGILIALVKTSAIFIETPEKPTVFKVNMQAASSVANKGFLGHSCSGSCHEFFFSRSVFIDRFKTC